MISFFRSVASSGYCSSSSWWQQVWLIGRWSEGGPDEIFKGALFAKFLSPPTGIWEDPVT
jgi:hypothetical protein